MNNVQLEFIIFTVYWIISGIYSWCFHVPVVNNKNRRVFACEKSLDFVSDIKKADLAKNISEVTFTYSNIPLIEKEAFLRFGLDLKTISITRSQLKSVQDGGFHGVAELETLVLTGNLLKIVKSAWFEGVSKLKTLKLNGNRISTIENEIGAVLPGLKFFDLSENQLHCLPENFLGFFHQLQFFNCRQNPWHYKCCYDIMEWARFNNELDFRPHYRDVQHIQNITRDCLQNVSTSLNIHSIDSCVDEKLNGMMENNFFYFVT
ncbi:slit homolog 1 protein-like [Prorops nasuta]|uniref:slit homolog 1 protein-like n=1 Tax=Prorops nasuta TaxID=863751 RepID=UPI0034CF1A55